MGNAATPAPQTIHADRGDQGHRLDHVVCRHLTKIARLSRTRAQTWIAEGRVTINGKGVSRPSVRVAAGDTIRLALQSLPCDV